MLNRDYISSVQGGEVVRFEEILPGAREAHGRTLMYGRAMETRGRLFRLM
jgi:hypothetical protein